jgi:hypothetical protein
MQKLKLFCTSVDATEIAWLRHSWVVKDGQTVAKDTIEQAKLSKRMA